MKKKLYALTLCVLATTLYANPTEFDHYLQQQQLIDEKFKIQNTKALNNLLAVLSEEDSRTLPLKMDANTVIDGLKLSANRTELTGLIITPDFPQLESQLGANEVKQMLHRNLVQNCNIFFEHQYQRANPYAVSLQLNSGKQNYLLTIRHQDCLP